MSLPAKPDSLCVALVCMPFFSAALPSIQIGLLHSITQRAGFSVDSYHLNLHLASRLSLKLYNALTMHRGHMTGEWLFSKAAFGKYAVSAETYCSAFPSEVVWLTKYGNSVRLLRKIQDQLIPGFLRDCMRITDWGKYAVVGFSSTFQQNVASLALAQRLKKRYPYLKIIFGGANMEGEMGLEYLRSFPFIDYVAVGEGDLLFADFLLRLSTGKSLENLPGLAYRSNGNVKFSGYASPIQDMNSLPTPNYDDYFRRLKRQKLSTKFRSRLLPLETARGCWWGEKHHCTFCGLNGMNMKFRAKSTQRVFTEIAELSDKYRSVYFAATDNILDLRYLKELFTEKSSERANYRFAWEIKANLTREQIRSLFLGGMRHLLPGIENLNSHILQLMRKGSTMLQNLITLKWCRYYGIGVWWNLLYGFPGEQEADYHQELAVLKLLSHLEPPIHCNRIWLERFAPYYFDRETFPVRKLSPEASYRYVYPPHVSLEKIAYFFDYEMEQTVPENVHAETRKWVSQWQQKWKSKPADLLTFHHAEGKLTIKDNRTLLRDRYALGTFEFPEPEALAYEFCSDTYRSVRQVKEHLQNRTACVWFETPVTEILDSFCTRGFMVTESGKYLALALPSASDSSGI